MTFSGRPRIEIEYCTQCRWLLRAAWMAQELLLTFDQEIGEVALVPGTGGVFEIRLDGTRIWSRKDHGGFPEIKELIISGWFGTALRRAKTWAMWTVEASPWPSCYP